jgi:hypothetical protein
VRSKSAYKAAVNPFTCYNLTMAYGDRLKRDADRPKSLLDHLRLILEHSNNAYTFQSRCKGQQIIIEKQPDNSIIAYYADDRDESITIDPTELPFDRIKFFYRQ